MFKKTLIIILMALIIGFSYFYSTIRTTAYTATGFSAKNICSGHFISGFSAESVMNEALKPVHNSFSYVSFNVDQEKQKVTTKIFGLFERNAVYSKGLGCTLLGVDQTDFKSNIKPIQFEKNINNDWIAANNFLSKVVTNINHKAIDISLNTAFKEPNDEVSRRTKAVVVIHNGQLIAEKYAQGINKDTPLLGWSMAKSITNMQVALLVQDGKIDIKSPVSIPQWNVEKSKELEKTNKQKITIDNLLRMSSGLEFFEIYGIASDAAIMLSVEDSASKYAENKPVIFKPDSHWAYSSGTSNIISAIIKRTIGGDEQQYYEYTQNKLFKPLGIKTALLEQDSTGTQIGSSYDYMSARDWAKLGQLLLQDGVWKGKRLLPEGWVNYSTTPTKTNPKNIYGAHFWLNKNPTEQANKRVWPSVPQDAFYMSGFQGQAVVVIPSKDLVVVRLGYTTPGTDKGIEKLLSNIIAALDI